MILVNVLLGFLQFFRAIPIMNPLPWFMIVVMYQYDILPILLFRYCLILIANPISTFPNLLTIGYEIIISISSYVYPLTFYHY